MSSAIRTDGGLAVEFASAEAAASWNRFVRERPDSHYGHRYEWRVIAELAYGRSCRFLVARRGDRMVGVLPLIWMPGRLGGRRLVSLPYLDLGGALAADAEADRALAEAALDLADELGARSVELRESGDVDEPAAGGRYRFVLELPGTTGELHQAIGPKVRNQIRKAERAGLTTRLAEPAELGAFYRVFSRNMRDLGSPVHSRRFLAAVLTELRDDAALYLTQDSSGRTVAGAIGIRHRDTLTVPWASSLRSARSSCPNHSLYWTILEGAVEAGLASFDFGRSSEGSGTFRFKKQWRATPVPLAWRRLDRTGSRPESRTAPSIGDRLAIAVWRRLPLPFANRLGPLARGRLPQ